MDQRDSVIKYVTEKEIEEVSFLMPIKSTSEKVKLMQSKKSHIDYYFSNLLLDSNKADFMAITGYNLLLKSKGFGLYDEINVNQLIY